jgi:hypothetical protein
MIILRKNILILFYKVDMDNAPFDPDKIWRYTIKRFADSARDVASDLMTVLIA